MFGRVLNKTPSNEKVIFSNYYRDAFRTQSKIYKGVVLQK